MLSFLFPRSKIRTIANFLREISPAFRRGGAATTTRPWYESPARARIWPRTGSERDRAGEVLTFHTTRASSTTNTPFSGDNDDDDARRRPSGSMLLARGSPRYCESERGPYTGARGASTSCRPRNRTYSTFHPVGRFQTRALSHSSDF